jgi:5-carboxymethyl-2-hydroxymuconate isomerase
MPHLTVEYSANLTEKLDAFALMERLSAAAVATGVFSLAGIRVRCFRADDYRVADGDPDNAYLHLAVRIGHGRDIETRKKAGQAIFAALCDHMAPIMASRPLAISLDIGELSPDLNFKAGNIRDYLKTRGKERDGR